MIFEPFKWDDAKAMLAQIRERRALLGAMDEKTHAQAMREWAAESDARHRELHAECCFKVEPTVK